MYKVLITIVALNLTLSVPTAFLLEDFWGYMLSVGILVIVAWPVVFVAAIGMVLWETSLNAKTYTAVVATSAGLAAGLTSGFIEPTLVDGLDRELFGAAYLVFAFLLTYAIFPRRTGISGVPAND